MQERSAAGALDIEAVWEHFRALAATSEQAGLPALVARFDAAPAQDRLALAGTIAGMLGPVEWPVAWREPRERLVRAIAQLLRVASASVKDDLLALDVEPLRLARRLLDVPCRRDELRHVADLCDLGVVQLNPDRRDARQVAFAVAVGTYIEAARGLNHACGVVLFKILEWRSQEASR